MRLVWLVPLLLLLPGCTEEDSSVTVVSQPPTGGNATTNTTPEPVVSMPVTFELVNGTVNIPAHACDVAGANDEIAQVPIVANTTRLEATFTLLEEVPGPFADNVLAYEPDNVDMDQADHQEAWDADDQVAWTFDDPGEGFWTFTLRHCDIPTGDYSIGARILVTAPEGSYQV